MDKDERDLMYLVGTVGIRITSVLVVAFDINDSHSFIFNAGGVGMRGGRALPENYRKRKSSALYPGN